MIAQAVITKVEIKAVSRDTYKSIMWVLLTRVSCASKYSIIKMGSNVMWISNTTEFVSIVESVNLKAASKGVLNHHILVRHDGITFDCNICQRKFNRSDSLDHHIKNIHEGLNYECHECDGVFTSIGSVKRHVNMVHKGLKFGCDVCGLKFASESDLSRHKQRMHFGVTV